MSVPLSCASSPRLLLAVGLSVAAAASAQSSVQPSPAALAAGWQAVARSFVANHGQWPEPAAFRCQRDGAIAWLGRDGIGVELSAAERQPLPPQASGPAQGGVLLAPAGQAALRLQFVGAAATEPQGQLPQAARSHFLLGQEPSQWRTDVPAYGLVTWPQAWPGIDVVARPHADGLLEYELRVAAGSDLAPAQLQWHGAMAMAVDADGGLCLQTTAGPLWQSAPRAFQVLADGSRLPLPVQLERRGDLGFGFRVAGRDPGCALVIDPVLTFHGGAFEDSAFGVARDPSTGRTIAAGYTSLGGSTFNLRNALVTCFDFTLPFPHVVWTTTLGGSGEDVAFGVAVDAIGEITCCGYTMSTNYPIQNAYAQFFRGGLMDGFVTKLTANGAGMVYSTYYGGAGNDWACAVCVDAQLQATIAGVTDSTNLPVVNAAQAFNAGITDQFVARFAAGGGAPLYATYHGGSLWEGFLWTNWQSAPINIRMLGLDVDGQGRILLGTPTWSSNYPVTASAYQTFQASPGGNLSDGCLTILDPSRPPAQQRVWSTYFGTSSDEGVMAAKFAPGGKVVAGGYTYSTGFPVTAGSLQPGFVGVANTNNAFLAWFDPALVGAAQRQYCTLLGGSANDGITALAVDPRGHATATGYASAGFPNGSGLPANAGGHQLVVGGNQDGFVVRVRPSSRGRQDLTYGTVVGGTQFDSIDAVAFDPDGGVLLAGGSGSAVVPQVAGSLGGTRDALVGVLEVLPTGCLRDATGATSHCAGHGFVEVDRALQAGQPFELLVGGVPASAPGVLVFGMPQACVPVLGANLCNDQILGVTPLLISSVGTAATLPMTLPAGFPVPVVIWAQAIWLDPQLCGQTNALNLTSSAMLRI